MTGFRERIHFGSKTNFVLGALSLVLLPAKHGDQGIAPKVQSSKYEAQSTKFNA